MKTMNYVIACCLVALVSSCGGETDPSELFDIQLEGQKTQFQQGTTVGVTLQSKKNVDITNIQYFIDGQELALENNRLTLAAEKLGNKKLTAEVMYGGKTVEVSKEIRLLAKERPKLFTYEVVNTYPHDPEAYTQGLEFVGDTLYESTGKRGQSTLRKLDYRTGDILQTVDLDPDKFGEGITILNNTIYQLTWQSGLGYLYRLDDLGKISSFSYGQSREGWGLCNDGTKIFKSDGTERIWYLDPQNLAETGYIEIVTNKSIFNKANELEYVDGKIYANVYGKESMMIINAFSGAIEGVINFGGLTELIDKGAEWDPTNSVLNGVAHHKERNTFFVTGKNWNKLFEVKISLR